jgi:ankyrin repeat protein
MKQIRIKTLAVISLLTTTAFAAPIHTAAETGDLAGVQAELDKGVDVNAKNRGGWSVLYCSARNGHKEVAELLIKEGADVNALTEFGWSAMHTAAQSGHKDVVELLITKGADVNLKDNEGGNTPLHNAVYHEEIVELLIVNGVDVNTKNDWGSTPLHFAAGKGNKETAELLITNGADVNAKDDDGGAPLNNAAFWGNKETAELLLLKGAIINEVVMTTAILRRNKEIVELLISAGMNVNAAFYLHRAVALEHKQIVELLIEAGADVNEKFGTGDPPLNSTHHFLHFDQEMFELLISKGAIIDTDVIREAIFSSYVAMDMPRGYLKSIIEEAHDLNVMDINGATPLHIVAYGGDKETTQLLISAGANVNAKNIDGLTVLDKAEEVGTQSDYFLAAKREIADLLRKHGGKTGEELDVLMPRLSFTRSPFGFTFNTIEGKTYRVESGMDLKKWNNLKEIKGTANEAKFIDVRRIYFQQHFYRVVIED